MQYELLNGLQYPEVEKVLALGVRIKVPSGAPLFKLGEPADRFFLVERGQIRLTLPMQVRAREQNVLVEEKSPGETVGWSALIPPYRFTLSATASVETEVIAISREALQRYFEGAPAVAYRIAQNVAEVVGHRLQLMQAMWLREVQRTVETRAAQPAAARS